MGNVFPCSSFSYNGGTVMTGTQHTVTLVITPMDSLPPLPRPRHALEALPSEAFLSQSHHPHEEWSAVLIKKEDLNVAEM